MTLRNPPLEAEAILQLDPLRRLCEVFADWSIEDYAALYGSDLSACPALARRLPKMPTEEVQRRWTWFVGEEAIRRSAFISHAIVEPYQRLRGSLRGATVLDYGAGWGRLTRMLYQFVPERQVHACDADPTSVRIFNTLGFALPCDQIEVTPRTLPYADGQFDLVFLWSVLTHLPPADAAAVMHALHRIVAPDGLLLVTVRPPTFWKRNPLVRGTPDEADLVARHKSEGIAHQAAGPHWGDTSMSLDYITRTCPQWQIVDTRDPDDDQMEVWLRRAR